MAEGSIFQDFTGVGANDVVGTGKEGDHIGLVVVVDAIVFVQLGGASGSLFEGGLAIGLKCGNMVDLVWLGSGVMLVDWGRGWQASCP